MSKLGLAREMSSFLLQSKKWWLLPIFIVLIMLGVLLIFAESSALAPFIYTLF
jgi:hypothetical protein